MLNLLNGFLKDEEGQSLVEYALLLALIAIVCIVAVEILGNSVKGTFEKTNTELQNK